MVVITTHPALEMGFRQVKHAPIVISPADPVNPEIKARRLSHSDGYSLKSMGMNRRARELRQNSLEKD